MSTMNRRQTLAPLSQSTVNARASIGRLSSAMGLKVRPSLAAAGASRQSLAAGRPSLAGRPSQTGRASSVGRRSSVYAGGAGSAGASSSTSAVLKMSDPRPVSDKQFQKAEAQQIAQFLMDNGYNHQIPFGKLVKGPSTNEFKSIADFLVSMYDGSYKLQQYEVDVPAFFKLVRYPFNLSKSALQSVGTPHTWPGVLGSLSWLTQLLMVFQSAEEGAMTPYDAAPENERWFLDYVSQGYNLWLAMRDAELEELNNQMAEQTLARGRELQESGATVRVQTEEKSHEIEELDVQANALVKLRRDVKDFRGDLEKLTTRTSTFRQKRAQIDELVERAREEKGALDGTLKQKQSEVARLQRLIDTQELSATDVTLMRKEGEQLDATLRATLERKGETTEREFALKMAEAELLHQLEAGVRQFNERAESLHIVPRTAKYAGGKDLTLGMAEVAGAEACTMSKDIRGDVLPALRQLRDELHRKAQEQVAKLLGEQEKLRAAQFSQSDCEARVRDLDLDVQHQEELQRQQQQMFDEEMSVKRHELEELDAQLARAHGEHKAAQQASDQEVRQAEAEMAMLREQIDHEQKQAADEMRKAIALVLFHKERMQQTLRDTASGVSSALKEL